MKVPEAVIKEAQPLIKLYGKRFRHLGDYEGQDAWSFVFPAKIETGFPAVYLVKGSKALGICGPAALSIVRSFAK